MEITPAEKKYKEMPFSFQVADFIFVCCVTPKGEDHSKADAVVLSAATLEDAEEYILPYYIECEYGEGAEYQVVTAGDYDSFYWRPDDKKFTKNKKRRDNE